MSTATKQTRENRTITVDFRDDVTYVQLLGDGKAFVECVCAFLLALGFQLAHKATCRGGPCPLAAKGAADMAHGQIPITRIAQTLGCSRHTVYKAIGQVQVVEAEAAD